MSMVTGTRNRGVASNRAWSEEPACGGVRPELIRRRAYEIFEARNGGPGDQASDWAQAERELCGAESCAPEMVRSGGRGVEIVRV